MQPLFQVIVPTKNSGRWIREFACAYRRVGLYPLYLLDSRTSDDTGTILRQEGMPVEVVTPHANRVEAVMSLVPNFCRRPWALRFDDDELPSTRLISWLNAHLAHIERSAVALPRRPCLLGRDGELHYSRAEVLFWNEQQPDILDPQIRLFRPDRVSYTPDIHTPGFHPPNDTFYAPNHAYFLHFDWIVRSAEERIKKLRDYELHAPGAGFSFAGFYLPECFPPDRLKETNLETNEFHDVAAALLQLRLSRVPKPFLEFAGQSAK